MERVLLIGDDPPTMELMAYLLESAGHEVVSAFDETQALASARETQPSLIVWNMHDPRPDGHALIRALREDPALVAIPVIAVASPAASTECDELSAAGFDGCLVRPIDAAAFMHEASRFLGRSAFGASAGWQPHRSTEGNRPQR